MNFREATIADIQPIQIVRNSVTENKLSNPALVPDSDVENYISKRGKGWVCEVDGNTVGFAIADLVDNNIWALFLLPSFEGKGIGKQLHNIMLDWYFSQTTTPVWLSTDSNSRAAKFYLLQGWQILGPYGTIETKFEMTIQQWKNK
jgi:GNAT superfamily N-acetyltransferase